MLQRLTEEMEYSYLLDRAAASTNSLEEMCFVAAFTISAYSTTSVRMGKPFNPLLGETYEMDRSLEEGWRCLAEQVSESSPQPPHREKGAGCPPPQLSRKLTKHGHNGIVYRNMLHGRLKI